MSRNYRFTTSVADTIDRAKQTIGIESKELLHQINNVLRLKPGHAEEVTFIDGSGAVFSAELITISKSKASFKILKTQKSQRELNTEISFFVPVIKADAFSWMIRKLTELGVQNFIPVVFERSQKQNFKALDSDKAYERLNKIIQEATEQCEGAVFAKLHKAIEFQDISKHLLEGSLRIFANERLADQAQGSTLKAQCPLEFDVQHSALSIQHLCLLVGPEGGLTDEEVKLLESLNFTPLGLGRRLLKAETAAISLVSKLL